MESTAKSNGFGVSSRKSGTKSDLEGFADSAYSQMSVAHGTTPSKGGNKMVD